MSTDTPRPERETLTDEECSDLWDLLADMRDSHPRDPCDVDTYALIDGILPWLAARDTAREQALREEIAGEIEAHEDQPLSRGFIPKMLAAHIARGGAR